jgi:hypothetical protein
MPPDRSDPADALTREIASLQQKNLELQDRLDAVLAPARSPDDLASALRRTVDNLQSELASLSNPVSNFAVKEFRLETSLAVGLTEVGTIEYRLLQPGANVDASAISKLTLSLVPIEKQPGGTLAPALFDAAKEVALIGPSESLLQLLQANHIDTIGDFRSASMRAQVRTSLLAAQATTREELALLQARAELMLLRGLDRTTADALIATGVDGLQALARSTPAGLLLLLKNADKVQLAAWIEAAQGFTGIAAAPEQANRVAVVDTVPAGLLLRMGEVGLPTLGPQRRQFPGSAGVPVTTFATQLKNRTGYAFTGWSSGDTQPATTLRPPGDVTASAAFRVAGHEVIAATVSAGGMIAIDPPIGRLPRLPADFYAAGSEVQLVVTPESGFALRALAITTGRITQEVTTLRTPLVVNAPMTAHATFVRVVEGRGPGADLPLPDDEVRT